MSAETFGIRLRAVRAGKGWSRAKLARALGLPSRSVYTWESDQSQPGAENLRKLALALGVTSDLLLGIGRVTIDVTDVSQDDRALVARLVKRLEGSDGQA